MNIKITRDSHTLLFIFPLFFNTSKTLIQIFWGIPKKIKVRYVASYNFDKGLKRYKRRINRIDKFLKLVEQIK